MTITGPEATIFACFVAAAVAIYIRRRNAFGAVAKEFISAFAPEVAELNSPARTKAVRDILVGSFQRHSEAVSVFRNNLSWFRKARFDKAWQEYHSGHEFDAEAWNIPKNERLFLDYFSIDDQPEAAKYALKKSMHSFTLLSSPNRVTGGF